jgi:hypothetical protein
MVSALVALCIFPDNPRDDSVEILVRFPLAGKLCAFVGIKCFCL